MISKEDLEFLASFTSDEIRRVLRVISIVAIRGQPSLAIDGYRGIPQPRSAGINSVFLRLVWMDKLLDPNNISTFTEAQELPKHIARMLEMV